MAVKVTFSCGPIPRPEYQYRDRDGMEVVVERVGAGMVQWRWFGDLVSQELSVHDFVRTMTLVSRP